MSEKSFFFRYCLVIPDKYQKISEYFGKVLKENDFKVETFTSEEKNKRSIFMCLSQQSEDRMLKEAQNLKLKKVYNGEDKIVHDEEVFLPDEVVKNEKLKVVSVSKKNDYLPNEAYDEFYNIIGVKKDGKSGERWGLGLFTESEMLYIEKSILENVQIPNGDKKDNELVSLLKETGLPVTQELLDESSLYHTLTNNGIIIDSFPLHVSNFPEKIIKKTLFSFNVPYRLIRSYFNDQVAFYFAWTYHYTKFLFVPGIFSILLFALMRLFPNHKQTFLTLYAITICLWTQFFSVFWNRKTSELKIEWDNYGDAYDRENTRKEFKGVYKKSPITEKYEKFYSMKSRLMQYFISFCVSMSILFMAFATNVLFLNLKGDIDEKSYNYLYYPSLRKLSRKGEVFEIGSTANTLIGVIQVICLTGLNMLNRKLAIQTTNNENHKVKSTYENSLILKRFVFEFLNSFFSLYYLAFVAQDLKGTRSMISGILYFNEIKRVAAQTIVPNLMKTIASKNLYQILNSQSDPERLISGKTLPLKEVIKQYKDSTYNTFDDYLELMLEFCYLTLFAECIPIAGILLIIVNTIEIRSDLLKLGTIVRRPEYFRKRNIGSWHIIINVVGIMSIFTNLLFSYTFSTTLLNKDKFGSLLSFCVWEHVVFALIIILRVVVPNTSYWVRLFMQRREYRMRNDKWKNVMNVFKVKLGKKE